MFFSKRKEGAFEEYGLNVRSKYRQILVCGPCVLQLIRVAAKVSFLRSGGKQFTGGHGVRSHYPQVKYTRIS
jgi:hypothetical protein